MKNNNSGCCRLQAEGSAFKAPPGTGERELTWVDLVGLYPAPRECLETFLVASAAEVIAGAKTANLIRIINKELPCGRSIFRLWRQYGAEVLKGTVLSVTVVRENNDGVSLLLYRRELLQKRLQGKTMQAFLKRCGYPSPDCLESSLDYLIKRFAQHESPDEVGFFLGYPAKDVRGFFAGQTSAWKGRCLWRIYGPPARSLKLYRYFCDNRRLMTARLVAGTSPRALLEAA